MFQDPSRGKRDGATTFAVNDLRRLHPVRFLLDAAGRNTLKNLNPINRQIIFGEGSTGVIEPSGAAGIR